MIDPGKKLCGLLIPVFALRRPGDLGIGDTGAMMDAIDFCAANGIAVLQVLPVNETGGDNSPYNALSAIALDPVLLTISPAFVPGLTPDMMERLASPEIRQQLEGDCIDYTRVKRLKLKLFRAAFSSFADSASGEQNKARSEFDQFKEAHRDWLEPYSLFRTLVDVYDGNACWPQWRPEHREPSCAWQWLSGEPQDGAARQTEFWSYVQWVAFRQWDAVRRHADRAGVALMGDLPFGVSRYSADVWAERRLFDLEWSGGAPPEPYFQEDRFVVKWGQNWGIPLYDWEAHRAQDFAWWRRRVTLITRVFHYFRIDHVLGFFRIYSFPWTPERNNEFLDLSQKEAARLTGGRLPHYKPRADYPQELGKKNEQEGRALLEMILEAAGGAAVVAEDLGTVPWYVRPLLKDLGIPGFAIPIFERHEDTREFLAPDELPPLSLATYATHDLMPLRLFYENLTQRWLGPDGHEAWLDVQRLMRFLALDDQNPPREFTKELHFAFIKTLLKTPCWLAVFMITDLLGKTDRYNQPGSAASSNWSKRMDMPLGDYQAIPGYAEKIRFLKEQILATGRLSSGSQVGTINRK